jgi:FkbM family methyltransferase
MLPRGLQSTGLTGSAREKMLIHAWVFLCAIFCSALLWRAYPYGIVTGDTASYIYNAWQFLGIGGDPLWQAGRTPGYGFLLLLGMATGHVNAFIFWVQATSFSACITLACWISMHIWPRSWKGPILAISLLLLEVFLMETFFHNAVLLTESLYSHFMLQGALLAAAGFIMRKKWLLIAACALLGLSYFLRPIGAGLAVFLPLLLWITLFRPEAGFGRKTLCTCLMLLILPAAIWHARMLSVAGLEGNTFAALHQVTHAYPLTQEGDVVFADKKTNDAFLLTVREMEPPPEYRAPDPFSSSGAYAAMLSFYASLTPQFAEYGHDMTREQFNEYGFAVAQISSDVAWRLIAIHPFAYASNVLDYYLRMFNFRGLKSLTFDTFQANPALRHEYMKEKTEARDELYVFIYGSPGLPPESSIHAGIHHFLTRASIGPAAQNFMKSLGRLPGIFYHLLLIGVLWILVRRKTYVRNPHVLPVAIVMIFLFAIAAAQNAITAGVTLYDSARFAIPASMPSHLFALFGFLLFFGERQEIVTRIKAAIWLPYGFIHKARGYFSQYGQDYWVAKTLRKKHEGYFVEAGASDGIRFSNTLFFEKYLEWNGICIEANDSFYKRLLKNRECHCIHACLGDDRKTVNFNEEGKEYGGIVSPDIDNAHVTQKMTIPLADILDECNAPKTIDYLSLDTEGSEYEILKTFPFSRYAFRALTIEHNFDELRRKNIFDLLSANGYRRVKTMGVDDCYVFDA